MQESRLAVTWIWVALALAISARSAPFGTRQQLKLSDRPIFTVDTSASVLTFPDSSGNHLDSSQNGQVEHVSSTPHYKALHSMAAHPPASSLADFSHYVPSAIAEVVHPPLSGPIAPLPDSFVEQGVSQPFPQATWAAPMLQSGAFAPIPHIEQTTVTIITTEAAPNSTAANVTQLSSSPAPDSTIATSEDGKDSNATQPTAQSWWTAPNDTVSQMNITTPPLLPPLNTTLPLPPPNVQMAQTPAMADTDAGDDDLYVPDMATNATAATPPLNDTTPRAAAPMQPQRRAFLPARLSKQRSGQVVYSELLYKRQTGEGGCGKSGAQVLVPVTHTELYEIRAGRLDPAFSAHDRLSSLDDYDDNHYVDTNADCPSTLPHHHVVLVPVSESQLADIDSGHLRLEASTAGQIVLVPMQTMHASKDLHAMSHHEPMVHFVEHDVADRGPRLTYNVAWPQRRSEHRSSASRSRPRLVRRVLESHGFDAKLVGNGENKTYHGRVIHNAGDGPYEDAHTIHLDSAPETKEKKTTESKPEEAVPAAPNAEPAPVPVVTNDKPKWKQGEKAGKKKKKGGPGKGEGAPPAPGPDAGAAAPPAAAVPPAPLDDDDRHDRDDVLDDVRDGNANGHDKAAALAYWDGKSDPSHSDKSKSMHNAATSLRIADKASLPCSIAVITLSVVVVALL